jgi:hypothetical protein
MLLRALIWRLLQQMRNMRDNTSARRVLTIGTEPSCHSNSLGLLVRCLSDIFVDLSRRAQIAFAAVFQTNYCPT